MSQARGSIRHPLKPCTRMPMKGAWQNWHLDFFSLAEALTLIILAPKAVSCRAMRSQQGTPGGISISNFTRARRIKNAFQRIGRRHEDKML